MHGALAAAVGGAHHRPAPGDPPRGAERLEATRAVAAGAGGGDIGVRATGEGDDQRGGDGGVEPGEVGGDDDGDVMA